MGKWLVKVLCLLFWVQLVCAQYDDVGLPWVKTHTQNDFNSHYQNWCVKQGTDGLIYVCNGNGMLVWDGENWQKHPTPNRSRIRAAAWWQDKLFVGTDNDLGFYAPDESGDLSYHSIIPTELSPQFGEVWSVVAGQDFVAFKTASQLYTWNGAQLRLIDETLSRGQLLHTDQGLFIKADNDEQLYQVLANEIKETGLMLPKAVWPRTILLLDDEYVMVTARHGLFRWQGGQITALKNPFPEKSYLYDAWASSDGFVYFASVTHGLLITDNNFNLLRILNKEHGLTVNTVTQVIQDQQGVLWLSGSPDIMQFYPSHQYAKYPSDGQSQVAFNAKKINGHVYVLGSDLLHLQQQGQKREGQSPLLVNLADFDGSYWALEPYEGQTLLLAGSGGLYAVEQQSDGSLIPTGQWLKVGFAYDLWVDKNEQRIYVSTSDGLFVLSAHEGQWQAEAVDGIEGEVRQMAADNDNHLWVGNSAGELFMVAMQTATEPAQLIRVFAEQDGIGKNKVVPFNILGKTYFGTHDGVMAYVKDRLEFVSGFPDIFTTAGEDVHLVVEEAGQDIVWYRIGSHSGYMIKQGDQWQTNELIFKPFPPRSINAFIPDGNALWFVLAGQGLQRLDRSYTQQLPPMGKLRFRAVSNENAEALQFKGYGAAANLRYEFQDNSLRLAYALVDHSLPGQSWYRTRLLGSQQEDWSEWTQETYKDLTQLRAGDYTFEVQARDGWGRLTEPVGQSISVQPPWYQTPWAWLSYLLLLLLLIYWVAKRYAAYQHQKLAAENLKLDALVKQKTQHLHTKAMELELLQKAKDRFFTDFSHELRTPLSLIMAPLEQANQKQPDHLLDVALSNAEKLKQQVNRIFDLQQLNDPVIRLNKSTQSLQQLLKQQVDEFKPWAEKHQQHLQLKTPQEPLEGYFDVEKIAAVISNLISNAIKYSGVGASIVVSCLGYGERGDEEHIEITVSDDGPGVPENQKAHIFERFFTAESANITRQSGVGVGLSYAKEIVEAHEGQLQLRESAKGACFAITLPVLTPEAELSHVSTTMNQLVTTDDHPSVMLVEDNDELREVLLMILAEDFVVHEFADPIEALAQVQQILPDGIISDVMMPGMSGVELTEKIRQIELFKATPILLLTAKTTQQDIQLGLGKGATDYMVKPFSPGELKLRINNHINTVKTIRQEFQLEPEKSTEKSAFIAKLDACLDELLPSGHVTIAHLAENLAIDRTTLFRKIKSEAEMSPSKYIMQYKLNKAAGIMKARKISVSEVAYVVGFESLAYFSTCFKQQFNCTPSEFIANP
jgi:signal transduction histidine kinase/DNA-binding response OmpR family regulator/ligand-binding sensor domain-containing protein